MNRLKLVATLLLLLLAVVILPIWNTSTSLASAEVVEETSTPEANSNTPVRYVGPFTNTTLNAGGAVLIDFVATPTTVSGYINFTNEPNLQGVLCGAANFSGTRTGNNFQFSFVSNDPEPGCHITHGTVYNVSGTISGNEIINGAFSTPAFNQQGVFNAKQTIKSNGRFFNDNLTLDGNVYVDLATWNNSVAGYINFTGDPDDPALCGANSFTGTRSGNSISFSFLSSDPDAGCDIIDNERFDVTVTLSGNSLQNGAYQLPTFGQGGTFSTAGPAVDTVAPNGNISSPNSGTNVGVGTHTISANVSDNNGGTGIGHVTFWVRYNGGWNLISTDPTPPYTAQWQTPAGLTSQQIRFAIDVRDKLGNFRENAGGTQPVNFIQSIGGNVQENWVSSDPNAYLNQRSLSPYGNFKCGGASTTMLLALNNLIPRNYNSLSTTANSFPLIFHSNGTPAGSAIYQLTAGLNNYGMTTTSICRTADNAWNTIRFEIDAGRPLFILSTKVTDGHYFTVMGYRYHPNNGNREIIVNDPFGRWMGVKNSYDANSTASDSHKGYWRTYDFEDSWGTNYWCSEGSGYLITASSNNLQMPTTTFSGGIPISPPGEISDEPETLVIYEGIGDVVTMKVYLPMVVKPD